MTLPPCFPRVRWSQEDMSFRGQMVTGRQSLRIQYVGFNLTGRNNPSSIYLEWVSSYLNFPTRAQPLQRVVLLYWPWSRLLEPLPCVQPGAKKCGLSRLGGCEEYLISEDLKKRKKRKQGFRNKNVAYCVCGNCFSFVMN